MAMDPPVHLAGNASKTPLRRKSILKFPIVQNLIANDDDAERLARRQSINVIASPTTGSPSDSRRSLGLSVLGTMSVQEMTEKMSECIKLNAQNKINAKNAFSLKMIDFMAYMITKQDKNMATLQMATTSLDVSTKIYGFRVDGVHTEILRMMGGIEKQNKAKIQQDEEQDQMSNDQESQVKKKKKRNKKHILATNDSLKRTIQTEKPMTSAMCQTDVQTADSLSQAILPLHSTSGFYLQSYNDIILDTVPEEQNFDSNNKCLVPQIGDFVDMEICPAFSNFNFLDESLDSPDEIKQDERRRSDNIFHFDLDASLPEDNDPTESNMNYFDMEHTDANVEELVNLCAPTERQVENIVDFRSVLNKSRVNKSSEYSVIQKSLNIHWTGPLHWKIRTFGRPLTNNSIETRAPQRPTRKRKVLELLYDPDIKDDVKSKFEPGIAIKLQAATTGAGWTEEKVMLPIDVHYDIKQTVTCYLHPTVISFENEELNEKSGELGDDNDHCSYSNDMINDSPDMHVDDFQTQEQNSVKTDELMMPNSQVPFTKENLVAPPKLANKLAIAYSTRAKKVDMRELKSVIWNSLTSNLRTEDINIEQTSEQEIPESISKGIQFHRIYKQLPGKLTKTNAEALSFPISFVSLLHLANEKSLILDTLSNRSDVIVKTE